MKSDGFPLSFWVASLFQVALRQRVSHHTDQCCFSVNHRNIDSWPVSNQHTLLNTQRCLPSAILPPVSYFPRKGSAELSSPARIVCYFSFLLLHFLGVERGPCWKSISKGLGGRNWLGSLVFGQLALFHRTQPCQAAPCSYYRFHRWL